MLLLSPVPSPVDPAGSSSLIDPTFLFRFELTLRRTESKWSSRGFGLDQSYGLPTFASLGKRPVFADIRMAWGDEGIGFDLSVTGKRSLPWCRDSRLEDSDGFHVWIDTRCSPGIHRATQFCHRFLFMPAGSGPAKETPLAAMVGINRARGNPKPVTAKQLAVVAVPRHDGYRMSGLITTSALTGFDPDQQPRIGFYCAVIDRELGWQTLTLGPEYPVVDDPSLWCEAVLC